MAPFIKLITANGISDERATCSKYINLNIIQILVKLEKKESFENGGTLRYYLLHRN